MNSSIWTDRKQACHLYSVHTLVSRVDGNLYSL